MKLADIQKAAKLQRQLTEAEAALESFTGYNRPSYSQGIYARVCVFSEHANKSDQPLGNFCVPEDEVRAVAEGRISKLKIALQALGVEVNPIPGDETLGVVDRKTTFQQKHDDLESEA